MQFTKENIAVLVVILLVLVLGSFYTWSVTHDSRQDILAASEAANSLASDDSTSPYTDLAGNPVALTDYLGDVLVVNSWASWSPFSVTELPLLAAAADSYKDQGVRVIAINRAEPATTAERFLRTVGVLDQVDLILDTDDRYYESIAGFSMPETVFYNRNGEVVYHQRGAISADQINKYITEALANPEF